MCKEDKSIGDQNEGKLEAAIVIARETFEAMPDFLHDPLDKIEKWVNEAEFIKQEQKKALLEKIKEERKEKPKE